MKSKLVIHFLDGRLVRGWSPDLFPNKPSFHVNDWETEESREIDLAELKGVFYVKEYMGKADHPSRRYDIERASIAFAGEIPPDPRLDIRVGHRFTQTTLYIDVVGRLSRPNVTFASDSGQYDQAQLLGMVLGSEPGDGQGETDADHKAAGAALAFAAGQAGNALRRSGLPIDAVKVGTEAGSERQVTHVTVGKWINDRMFIAYRRRFEAEVTENQNEGVFQHFFARDWMWEGAAGDRGTASVDLLWIVPF